MNQVTLVGRLVREIQLQEVGESKSVVNNTIAVQRIFKTEQQQQADYSTCCLGESCKIIRFILRERGFNWY